ncbi:hypothetical protein AWM68_08960 [Fictibacillus phosphorivorans]|uniref:Uncharacterized protein n=1 Tax=Fictibacillus phosphorivorans TaxID=1221500 RepID=A0A163Q9T6_9BACL|nr:hypothetical protein [Fictibacillus phosphorivorans]KZE64783.1 hypothetical protein AWM68_08960 [Fictibacillus phosphorivorans]
MFELLILFIAIVVIAPLVLKYTTKPNYQKVAEKTVLPPQLGIRDNLSLDETVGKMERALPYEFKEKMKRRYLAEHPKATEAYFEAIFYELQRFFIMCSLLNNVPMFGKKVDDIWHEMLMYTKEYEKFSSELCKEHIHHAPNDVVEPDPYGRAWFDLLYAKLFTFTDFTPIAWGTFFQNPLHHGLLHELHTLSVEELGKRYFRENADQDAIHALLTNIKEDINRLSKENDPYKGLKVSPHSIDSVPILAGAMLYYSYYHSEQFEMYMGKLNPASSYYSGNTTAC